MYKLIEPKRGLLDNISDDMYSKLSPMTQQLYEPIWPDKKTWDELTGTKPFVIPVVTEDPDDPDDMSPDPHDEYRW